MYYIIASGKKKSKISNNIIEELELKLKEKKVNYKLLQCHKAGEAIEFAKTSCQQKDCQAIIAVGGDGTFYEVLNGMDTKIPIGFIPAGTGNDFVRTLGIGLDVEENLNNILYNEPKYLDYLKIGNQRSFNIVGTGFDIQLLKREEKIRKKINSRLSYHIALMQTILFAKFNKVTYRIDDGEKYSQKFFLVACCNGIWAGGMMPLCIDADPHDGFIDFIVIDTFNKFKLLPLLLKFKKGTLSETKYVHRYRCKKVEIAVEPHLETNLDGEVLSLFPNTIEIVHNELKYFPSNKKPIDPLILLNNRKLRKNVV